MMADWGQFFVSAAVIIFAGVRLTSYADILGDRFNIHKAWVGVALLGLVTSLPEAITSITAVVSLGAVDLAIGNLLGSNVFNPMLVVVLDFAYRKGSVTSKIAQDGGHAAPAFFAIALSFIVLADILSGGSAAGVTFGYMSFGSVLIAVVYLAGIRILAKMEGKPLTMMLNQESRVSSEVPLPHIYFNLLASTLLVVGSAIWLANIGETLAQTTGLGQTLIGSLLVAFVTSLPEIVVSLSALKMGALDLAIGNIFGSNMINIFIVFLCGLCYTKGPILSSVSSTHIITVILSIILVSLAIVGMRLKNKKTFFNLGWDSLLMIACFFGGTGLVYYFK